MQMVYNSDSYVVMQFDAQAQPQPDTDTEAVTHTDAAASVPEAARAIASSARHPAGFEIVDKLGRADVYLHGAVAERFQRGAQALMQQSQGQPDVEVLDNYIAGFATLGRQPLALH